MEEETSRALLLTPRQLKGVTIHIQIYVGPIFWNYHSVWQTFPVRLINEENQSKERGGRPLFSKNYSFQKWIFRFLDSWKRMFFFIICKSCYLLFKALFISSMESNFSKYGFHPSQVWEEEAGKLWMYGPTWAIARVTWPLTLQREWFQRGGMRISNRQSNFL